MKDDIEKFAERKMPFFYLVLSLWVHKMALEETVGIGFTRSLFIHRHEMCALCVSREEIEHISARVLELVRANDPRLEAWYKRAKSLNVEADKLLAEYKDGLHETSLASYDKAVSILVGNAGYCTILPYWVLYGINSAIEKGADPKSFGSTLAMYEELKGQTRYPQIAQTVMSLYLKKAASIFGTTYELATCLHPKELKEALEGKKPVSVEELQKRMDGCGMTRGRVPYDVDFTFDPTVIERFFGEKMVGDEMKGQTAYKGKIRSIAKIVNSMSDMKKFNEGDILVSIQSSPSLMEAIGKCSAIVADEGGIMCHASIISRELKKPCVIGTKVATKLIKDGDTIEVDGDKGVVRVIKRA